MVRTSQLKDIWRNLMAVRILSLLLIFNSFIAYSQIKLGIDVLIENGFAEIKNKNCLLFTNFAGRNNQGKLTVDVLNNYDEFKLLGILAPEHGFFTTIHAGQNVQNDNYNGIPIFSTYSINNQHFLDDFPTCDVIIVDIQDIGVRSYTYISSLFYLMKKAAEKNIEIIILDRPNPLGGLIIDGNVLEEKYKSFVGIVPIPYIHSLTIGELALMIKGENWLNLKDTSLCKLSVIRMKGWQRWMHWEDTKLNWFPTSPHVPTVNAIWGLASVGIFGELGIISIGIGTTLPFQYIGSPNFNVQKVLDECDSNDLQGISLHPTKFRPFYGIFANKDCNGIFLTFNKNNLSRPYSSGIKLFTAINKIYPELFDKKQFKTKNIDMFIKVTGTKKILDAFLNHQNFEEFQYILNDGIDNFLKLRNQYKIYD